MEKVLESFLTLVARLQVVNKNAETCIALRVRYRPINASTNSNTKIKAGTEIAEIFRPIYETNRDKIVEKDFSFLLDEDGILMIQGKDIGKAYANVMAEGSDEEVKKITGGLLNIFYLVAPDPDQKIIEERHAKKEEPAKGRPNFAALGSGRPNVSIARKMEKMLDKHKDSLKRAENDPAAISGLLGEFFHENSRDVGNLVTGLIGDIGIDPSTQ